jgi:hypothetical protein
MHVRKLMRIALLLAAVALVTLSCGVDYWMDFEITNVSYTGTDAFVAVSYTMQNNGAYDMENAAIHVQVTANVVGAGTVPQDLWTPDGVSLPVYGSVSRTMIFAFGSTVTSATAIVIGARWDRSSGDL